MTTKQLIITAAITLITTIFSGIIVNWYTKNNIENNNLKLVYDISELSYFQTDSTKIALVGIDINNKSKSNLNNIVFKLNYGIKAEIIDLKAENIRTKDKYNATKSDGNVTYNFEKLFPEDKVKINLAIKNFNFKNLDITLQSNEVVGNVNEDINEKNTDSINIYLRIILLSICILILIYLLSKKLPIGLATDSNLNNTAFLFLHNKLIGQSKKFIYNKIEKSGATSFELSNLALTEYYSSKNLQKSESLIKMAKYISNSKQSKFVINFNEFIIYAINKDYIKAKEKLEICHQSNPKELKKYLEFSLIITDLKQDDNTINELITNLYIA